MESLREKQEEFTAITENMSEGFLVLDHHTDILSYNTSALRLLGCPDASADGRESALTLNRSSSFRSVVDGASPASAASSCSGRTAGAARCWQTRCSGKGKW